VVKLKYFKNLSLTSLQKYIAELPTVNEQYRSIELANNRIYSFFTLIHTAIQKLLISSNYQEFKARFRECCNSKIEQIKAFLYFCEEFECRKVSVPIRGPCALSIDFYLTGGSYFNNSYFLFGTPSQFRSKYLT